MCRLTVKTIHASRQLLICLRLVVLWVLVMTLCGFPNVFLVFPETLVYAKYGINY